MSDTPRYPYRFTVRKEKITRYLLDLEHPQGGPKARFFLAFGFSIDRPDEMIAALAGHFLDDAPSRRLEEPGKLPKLVFEGTIRAPDGRSPRVRTVWWIEDEREAHFVTAVPLT